MLLGEIFSVKLLPETIAIGAGGGGCTARPSRGRAWEAPWGRDCGFGLPLALALPQLPGQAQGLRRFERGGGNVSHSEARARLPGKLCEGLNIMLYSPGPGANLGSSGVSLGGQKGLGQLACSLAQPCGKSTGR